jgi:septal ring factor EnvC (AmiA/AmiB activator)
MTQYEDQDCITCFIRFGVPVGFTARRRQDKQNFYCPNGHQMAYTESEADRIRRERDRLRQQLAERDDEIARQQRMREAAERQAAAARGQVTKLKNRASAGVCPCCNRTFRQLAAHMRQKHPTYMDEGTKELVQ